MSIERGATDGFQLILSGAPGHAYQLETSSSLRLDEWNPWLSFTMGVEPLRWSEPGLGLPPAQFFRLRSSEPDTAQQFASNFRLLDQGGVARDLFYHSHLRAITVVAAGTNLAQIASLAPLIEEFTGSYSNSTLTWILVSDPSAVRSNLAVQARSIGIARAPILLDGFGVGARAVGLTRVGEAAVLQPPGFTVAYRGPVTAPGQLTAAQSFVGRALASIHSGLPVTYARTPATGPLLPHASEPTPDYGREIAPIFHQYCAKCHRPNSVAPFALTNHSVAATWAPSIKHALLSNLMPPWHADPEYGRWANDLSLPGDLKSAVIRWIDAGAPRGEGPDPLAELPAPSSFDAWPADLGEPDALVTIPEQPVKATGSEAYRYIFVQTPNPSNVWLRAAIIRPSNYQAVHHYLVWPGRIGNTSTTPDNSSYEPYIAEFVPGHQPLRMPADAGVFLSRSNWLTFNLHYTPYGVATNDRPVLALWYHTSQPAKRWRQAALLNTTFTIPPMEGDFGVQAPQWPVTSRPITIQRFNPHMHLRGKRMKYEVIYPNGVREVLLSVPDYDFNWQIGYQLTQPITLPVGSRLIATGAFDNSPQNLNNPDPSARVIWGDQSWMEMFAGFFEYTQ